MHYIPITIWPLSPDDDIGCVTLMNHKLVKTEAPLLTAAQIR
jgi:hypothetical protein